MPTETKSQPNRGDVVRASKLAARRAELQTRWNNARLKHEAEFRNGNYKAAARSANLMEHVCNLLNALRTLDGFSDIGED